MPVGEKRGRRHSSEVTVVTLADQAAQPYRSRYGFDGRDVRVDTFRSSGAGGQHRNKTDSGVRLTHLATGTVVTATEERSQHLNRAVAWTRLETLLAAAAAIEAHTAENAVRRELYDEFRSWTWCGWRDEVKGPDGRKASMSRVLAGRLHLVL